MAYDHISRDFIHKPNSLSASQGAKGMPTRIKQVWGKAVVWLHRVFSNNLAVDLGTSNTVIYVPDDGIVLNEPSFIALDSDTNNIIAVGREAKLALGRQASTVRIVRPLKDGVIADFDATELMLYYFIKCALARRKL